LDDQGLILSRDKEFFFLPPHQDQFGAYPSSCPVGIGGSLPRDKAAWACS